MNVQKSEKGFTIIEVVLVLAIAGLIFLMVFIALPALQRSQRDTQRRSDISTVVSQLNSYATNNNGNLPADNTAFTSFLNSYVHKGVSLKDPKSGNAYTVSSQTSGSGTVTLGQIQYQRNRQCSGENIGTAAAGTRQAAVRIQLEGAGYFCKNVQN